MDAKEIRKLCKYTSYKSKIGPNHSEQLADYISQAEHLKTDLYILLEEALTLLVLPCAVAVLTDKCRRHGRRAGTHHIFRISAKSRGVLVLRLALSVVFVHQVGLEKVKYLFQEICLFNGEKSSHIKRLKKKDTVH